MSRRALLALSTLVSAFVLVLIGAVGTLVARSRPAPAAQATESVSVDVVRQREAEYRRLLDEANARLRAQRTARASAAESASRAEVSPSLNERRVDDDDGEHHARERHHERHEEDDDG